MTVLYCSFLFFGGVFLTSALRGFHFRLMTDGDDQLAAWLFPGRNACPICEKRKKNSLCFIFEMLLFRFPGCCPRCGKRSIRAPQIFDLGGGFLCVFIIMVYAPFVSSFQEGGSPWILSVGGASLAVSFLLLVFSALTDGITGLVWNVSGGGSALTAALGMSLLGRSELLVPFCAIGWSIHMISILTGTIGEGDSAPASAALLFALAPEGVGSGLVFPAHRTFVFIFIVALSTRIMELAIFLMNGMRRHPSPKKSAPLVPHLLIGATLLVFEGVYLQI